MDGWLNWWMNGWVDRHRDIRYYGAWIHRCKESCACWQSWLAGFLLPQIDWFLDWKCISLWSRLWWSTERRYWWSADVTWMAKQLRNAQQLHLDHNHQPIWSVSVDCWHLIGTGSITQSIIHSFIHLLLRSFIHSLIYRWKIRPWIEWTNIGSTTQSIHQEINKIFWKSLNKTNQWTPVKMISNQWTPTCDHSGI